MFFGACLFHLPAYPLLVLRRQDDRNNHNTVLYCLWHGTTFSTPETVLPVKRGGAAGPPGLFYEVDPAPE